MDKINEAIQGSNWRYAIILGLIMLIAFVRAHAGKIPLIGPRLEERFKSGFFTWVFAVALAGLGALAVALERGVVLSPRSGFQIFFAGAFIGTSATGVFKGLKEAQDSLKKKPELPPPPGVLAAGTPLPLPAPTETP